MTIKDTEFQKLTMYIKQNYGIDLHKKKSMIEGRLSSIIVEKGFSSFKDYLDSIINDKTGDEITVLINKLTTNHSFFMRETNHFDFYRDRVLPYIVESEKSYDLRVWSAGCATGEEPYTLAMINRDFFESGRNMWNTQILATDISVRALESAKKGSYSKDNIAPLPNLWQLNYFKKAADGYTVCDEIRNEVIFRIFNLMDDSFPFKRKFHAIFCRNVMIYFDEPTKQKLVSKFYNSLEPGGYFFIGHSEFITRETTAFQYVMPAVYRKGLNDD